MSRELYGYAFIKSLCDKGTEYLDSFWPLIIKAVPERKREKLDLIQGHLTASSGLSIPIHVLEGVLVRAAERGFVERVKIARKIYAYGLSSKGAKYMEKLEPDREVERRINALVGDIAEFFRRLDSPIGEDEVRELLLAFVKENLDPLIEFVSSSDRAKEPHVPVSTAGVALLVGYVAEAERKSPEHFKTFQDMLFGSIVSSILYADNPADVTSHRRKGFKPCEVYMDTNFVLSLLEMRPPEYNAPAVELYALLRECGFRPKLFSFTVDEICGVLGRYPSVAHRYPRGVRVDSLYSSLRIKGWTGADCREYIANIESHLAAKGISIEVTGVDLNKYKPADPQWVPLMTRYKPDQYDFQRNHDMAAVEFVARLRGKPTRKLEETSVIFLTSDVGLNRFAFDGLGHRGAKTLSEVILDRLLTSVLWLKHPNFRVSLKSVIAAYSRNLFVQSSVWDRFYDKLAALKKDGKISGEQVSTLFYYGHVEDTLRGYDEYSLDDVDDRLVIDEIDRAGLRAREELNKKVSDAARAGEEAAKKRLQEQEEEFQRKLAEGKDRERTRAAAEADEKWLAKIKSIKDSVRTRAHAKAQRATIWTRVAVALAFLLPAVLCARCGMQTGNWVPFFVLGGVFTIIGLLAAVVLDPGHIWSQMERKLSDNYFQRDVRVLNLQSVEPTEGNGVGSAGDS